MPLTVTERVVAAVGADLAAGSWDDRHGHLRVLEAYDAGLAHGRQQPDVARHETTPPMDHPDIVVVHQREVAPGRVRSLLRSNDRERRQVRFFVAEIDRIVDCGQDWNRAAEVFAADVLG